MKLIFTFFIIITSQINAYELGTIATGSKTGTYYKLANDISSILKEYDMKLEVINTGGSFENLDILNGNYIKNKNTFFAITQKDAISYYNYNQVSYGNKSIYQKLPSIISLGTEDIHILTSSSSDFDFEIKLDYNVYCGDYGSGSCITAKYIENAYNFNFTYINSKETTLLKKITDKKIDLYFKVTQKPASTLKDAKGLKIISLPDNLVMNKMYEKSMFTSKDYSWIDNDVSSYIVQKVLVSNLSLAKYEPVLNNIVKIIISNKNYLIKNHGDYWKNADFKYTNFKYMPDNIKTIIANSNH